MSTPPSPDSLPEAADGVPFSLIVAVWSLVALGTIALLWFASAFFIPLLLGITLAYVMRPAVDALARARVPRGIGALLAVVSLVGAIVGSAWLLADDAARVLETIPRAAREIRVAVQDSRPNQPQSAVSQVREAARELDRAAAAATGQPAPSSTAPAPSLANRAQEYVVSRGIAVAFTLGQALFVFLLAWFVLSEGDTFKRKLLRMVGPSFERKKITVRILDEIDRQVQRQVGTMFIMNAVIGAATGVAFALIGVEHALFWGVVAGLLHFVPYVGQALVTTLSSAAAYLQFGTWASAASVAAITLGLSFAVGTVLTTFMQSRASRINPTVLFVAVLFFGWLWGAWGLVLAAPIVAMVKSVCDHVEAFAPAREFLSGRAPAPPASIPAPAE